MPPSFLTWESMTCAAFKDPILALFIYLNCWFCPLHMHWAWCPALKETKVVEKQLCFHSQLLAAKSQLQQKLGVEGKSSSDLWHSNQLILLILGKGQS